MCQGITEEVQYFFQSRDRLSRVTKYLDDYFLANHKWFRTQNLFDLDSVLRTPVFNSALHDITGWNSTKAMMW